jgi:hypothetical protein
MLELETSFGDVGVEVTPSNEPSPGAKVALVVGTLATLGVIFGAAAWHGNWAYGDWTCAFKRCVAVAKIRRRKRKR